MDVQRSLHPGPETIAVFVLLLAAMLAVALSTVDTFTALHPVLDTAAFLLTAVIAFLLWDMGWRTGEQRSRLEAVCFAVVALLELLHVITALDIASGGPFALLLKLGTWSPAAYLLPLGLLVAIPLARLEAGVASFAGGLLLLAACLMLLFAVQRYSAPGFLGITRPTLLLAPLLWIPVVIAHWRSREGYRLSRVFAVFAAVTALVPLLMLYSRGPADKIAVIAHFVRVGGEIYLLFSLMQMGTVDTARRMRAERELMLGNEELEARVAARTAELERLNADLRREVGVRQMAESQALELHGSLRQAYEDLRLTQEAALEQERLRALGQMASGVAHDINNAISPASLYVELLLENEPGFTPRSRHQLEIVQRAVDDVAQTVKRLGEFYRRRPAQIELVPVDVGRVLRDVLDLTRVRWSDMAQQRGVVIDARIDVDPGAPSVLAVESELREALVNLVLNATDAMPEGGTLTLRGGRAPGAGDGAPPRVYVEVVDTGVGMDEDTRRRCLEPFFTTKGDRGSGLGLAMVYGIAQRQNLEIDITSAPGKGTAFRLTFPVTDRHA